MKLLYNGTDIYNDVSVNYCVHEMYAEKQADTLVVRFNDTKGVWSKWNPAIGDTLQFKEGSADTGKMFIHSMKPENGLFTVRAMSMPQSGTTKKSKSWEGVRLLQLGNEFAGNHGLTFKQYGVTDQVYPYLKQENEPDFAFFRRLCTLEGCQMLFYDGQLLAYKESKLEGESPTGTLDIDANGQFTYRDDRAECYGSCVIASGSYSGKFTAPGTTSKAVLRPAERIRVTSNGEASRFAKGLLRDANKYGHTGQFTKQLQTGYAAASVVTIKTAKASAWDGDVFVYKVRHDYYRNQTTLYFRKPLEGY